MQIHNANTVTQGRPLCSSHTHTHTHAHIHPVCGLCLLFPWQHAALLHGISMKRAWKSVENSRESYFCSLVAQCGSNRRKPVGAQIPLYMQKKMELRRRSSDNYAQKKSKTSCHLTHWSCLSKVELCRNKYECIQKCREHAALMAPIGGCICTFPHKLWLHSKEEALIGWDVK